MHTSDIDDESKAGSWVGLVLMKDRRERVGLARRTNPFARQHFLYNASGPSALEPAKAIGLLFPCVRYCQS